MRVCSRLTLFFFLFIDFMFFFFFFLLYSIPGNYSCLQVEMIFSRDRTFYFATIFIPGLILVTSSFITFFLEWDAVPARTIIGHYQLTLFYLFNITIYVQGDFFIIIIMIQRYIPGWILRKFDFCTFRSACHF